MTREEYLKEFESFGRSLIDSFQPQHSGDYDTLKNWSESMPDLEENLRGANDQLIEKANTFLKEANSNPDIDVAELKAILFTRGKDFIAALVTKFKG